MLLVDQAARTVAGLAVPYDTAETAEAAGWRYRYAFGSIRRPTGRVPLLLDHMWSVRLGRVLELNRREGGMWALVLVRLGRAGDRALAQAADGSLGFSVQTRTLDSFPDPLAPSVHVIADAELVELSLTRNPALGR